MRDSTIFYRSFYEAIKDLPAENQAEVYSAIFEYSLNFNEVELSGLSKTIFTLIKPQLEANIKRYLSGTTPKQKQVKSETEAKPKRKVSEPQANHKRNRSETEANVNVNVNVNEECKLEPEQNEILPLDPDFLKFCDWIGKNCPNVAKLKPISENEFFTLKKKYTKETITEVLMAMENTKNLTKKYVSAYLTLTNWIELRKQNPKNNHAKPTDLIAHNAEVTRNFIEKHFGELPG